MSKRDLFSKISLIEFQTFPNLFNSVVNRFRNDTPFLWCSPIIARKYHKCNIRNQKSLDKYRKSDIIIVQTR
nr:MAG TPA: hypothetical protein [Caudoviricetes sp.]